MAVIRLPAGWLAGQDALVDLAGLRGGFQAGLGGQAIPVLAEGGQRPGLVTGGGESPGQQQHRGLAQRLGRHRLPGPQDSLRPGSRVRAVQGGGRGSVQCLQVSQPQMPPVGLRPVGVGVFGERLAAPDAERHAERGEGPGRARGQRGRPACTAARNASASTQHRRPSARTYPPGPVRISVRSPSARRKPADQDLDVPRGVCRGDHPATARRRSGPSRPGSRAAVRAGAAAAGPACRRIPAVRSPGRHGPPRTGRAA